MKKILIPLDGTERSIHSISLVKQLYDANSIDIILMYVKEDAKLFIEPSDFELAEKEMQVKLAPAVRELDGYKVACEVGFVEPGKEILKSAKINKTDIIVMTKSTKKGLTRIIGSVTNYVVRHASCVVMIVPE